MKTSSLLLSSLLTSLAGLLPLAAQEQAPFFQVKDGEAPWSDRVHTWQLANIPTHLTGKAPLPQQNCGSRHITVPGHLEYLLVGVYEKDTDKFKADYPEAALTGDSFSVLHPDGTGTLPYTIFKLDHPPESVGDSTLGAGLVLLQLGGKSESSAAAPSTPATPVPPAKPATFQPSQNPFETGPREKLHIYLLMGQSNMVGRDTTGLETQTPDPRIGYFDGKSWIIAIEPMKGGSGFGPGTFFARDILPAYPDGKVGLVPCAVGGTPLSRWVKGADLYENALKRARLAAQSGVIEGILWHQGESDSSKAEDATTYEARLTQMFTDFRKDLGQPDLPIVVGQLGTFVKFPQVETVKTALTHLPNDLPHVALADSEGLTHKGDQLHFNAASQSEFGKRYAEAMEKLKQLSIPH